MSTTASSAASTTAAANGGGGGDDSKSKKRKRDDHGEEEEEEEEDNGDPNGYNKNFHKCQKCKKKSYVTSKRLSRHKREDCGKLMCDVKGCYKKGFKSQEELDAHKEKAKHPIDAPLKCQFTRLLKEYAENPNPKESFVRKCGLCDYKVVYMKTASSLEKAERCMQVHRQAKGHFLFKQPKEARRWFMPPPPPRPPKVAVAVAVKPNATAAAAAEPSVVSRPMTATASFTASVSKTVDEKGATTTTSTTTTFTASMEAVSDDSDGDGDGDNNNDDDCTDSTGSSDGNDDNNTTPVPIGNSVGVDHKVDSLPPAAAPTSVTARLLSHVASSVEDLAAVSAAAASDDTVSDAITPKADLFEGVSLSQLLKSASHDPAVVGLAPSVHEAINESVTGGLSQPAVSLPPPTPIPPFSSSQHDEFPPVE